MRGLAGEIRKSMNEGQCQAWKTEPLPDNCRPTPKEMEFDLQEE